MIADIHLVLRIARSAAHQHAADPCLAGSCDRCAVCDDDAHSPHTAAAGTVCTRHVPPAVHSTVRHCDRSSSWRSSVHAGSVPLLSPVSLCAPSSAGGGGAERTTGSSSGLGDETRCTLPSCPLGVSAAASAACALILPLPAADWPDLTATTAERRNGAPRRDDRSTPRALICSEHGRWHTDGRIQSAIH